MGWYCQDCDRDFDTHRAYTQHHRHSKTHMGSSIQCPFCRSHYPTAGAVTIHLESGSCVSGLNRHRINELVQRLDRGHVITRPMLTLPGYGDGVVETLATVGLTVLPLRARVFASLHGLNNHIRSPVHEQSIYRCPKRSCAKEFRLLSGLVQHVESESCGVTRFTQVQEQARGGIQNMVGRMIAS